VSSNQEDGFDISRRQLCDIYIDDKKKPGVGRLIAYPFTRALDASELTASDSDPTTGGSDSSTPLTVGARGSVTISEAMIDW
jgi:hypothetical protein